MSDWKVYLSLQVVLEIGFDVFTHPIYKDARIKLQGVCSNIFRPKPPLLLLKFLDSINKRCDSLLLKIDSRVGETSEVTNPYGLQGAAEAVCNDGTPICLRLDRDHPKVLICGEQESPAIRIEIWKFSIRYSSQELNCRSSHGFETLLLATDSGNQQATMQSIACLNKQV